MAAPTRINRSAGWQSYGPLATAELWQCREGAMLLTLEAPTDDNQGIDMRERDTFEVPSGKTVRLLGNALWSREVLG